MKNKQITLAALAVGLLAGCMPEKNANLQGSKPSATPLRFVVTQPASPEGAKEIVSALSESLTAIAKASNGATVPIPEIRILRGNGKDGLITVTGVAPSGLGVVLFGDQTPSAKKELLSNTLAALDSALRSGAQGKPVDVGTIEASAKIVFKGYTFTTFVPGGGSIPWESKAVGPVPVIDDRGVFMQKVVADQSGGFLVLADPVGSKAAEGTSPLEKNPSKSALDTPADALVKTNSDVKEPLLPPPAIASPAVQRDNIVIQVDATGKQPSAPAPAPDPRELFRLPPQAEMIGEPILFGYDSDKLNSLARNEVKHIARLIKGIGPRVRVLLLAKTDPRGTAKYNETLAGRRAEVVVAALLEEQVNVERTIAVGARLSPDDAAKAEFGQFREVRVFVLHEEVVKLSTATFDRQ